MVNQIGFTVVCKGRSIIFFFLNFLLQDLDHQRRRLEEDNKRLRAEIQQLEADAQTLTRVIQEAQRAHGLDVSHRFIFFLISLKINK